MVFNFPLEESQPGGPMTEEEFLLESVDVPLSMDEIYRKVNFDEPLAEE